MLPYIEQGPLYNAFNASIGIEGPSLLGYLVNSTVLTTKIPSFQCPSDNAAGLQLRGPVGGHRRPRPPFPWSPTKGNYGVNWGNADYGQGASGGFFTRNLYLQSPFGINATATGPMRSGSPRSRTGRAIPTSSRRSCRGRPTTSAGRSGPTIPARVPT